MQGRTYRGEGEHPRVGYAFVVPQRLGKVYPPRRALAEGTIFPELNIGIQEYTRGIWNGK